MFCFPHPTEEWTGLYITLTYIFFVLKFGLRGKVSPRALRHPFLAPFLLDNTA